MHLDRRACQDYYCSQLQNGGSYFQGVSHQRGYGMFSNLFRMISPIAMKAGKYLGKHILSTGSKVMSDVVSGTSLKDSTRARLKETSKNIKDDILHKLQSGSGIKRKKSRNKNHLPRAKRSRKNSKAAVDIFS
ncbi:uncharacterized protein TNCT_300071 [Trichonephila clavata]|uniref:Uncharacterized protein n=2 Tax=Trichonephila clavata TaxID=2740835 RepID=A0A8X6GF71_TRICU|nr:uncharacterized protein TNCT_148271 [Trichonephila clavata]GFQ80919.1 uncharacterized protein TNCT_435181 [Trichonephila clavata]GFR02773.1 uncharacterized protein TNCT_423781 [Trichonephila clavata]GFR21810.1 uncharacterized protein TNCT_482721 [Trichonephila clavata]GFR23282.1 uncharacterized protein TNCT_590111 [Trichonephila clavata]